MYSVYIYLIDIKLVSSLHVGTIFDKRHQLKKESSSDPKTINFAMHSKEVQDRH